jgi:hypothetical protein
MDAVRAEAGAAVPVNAIFKKAELEAHWQSRQANGTAASAAHHAAAH